MAFRELGIDFKPDLTTQDSLCKECVWQPYTDRSYVMRHRSHVSKFKALNKDQKNPCWISKRWLSDWIKDKPSMHHTDTGKDPAPDSGSFLQDTFCRHGLLEPDPSNRQLMTERVNKAFQIPYNPF